MDKALVLNIQRFSIHDGEGIRTTIFFKGCGLHCKWCHNPESQKYYKQVMRYGDRCKTCGACTIACPNGAVKVEDEKLIYNRDLCDACGKCIDFCAYDAAEVAGEEYTVDQLVDIAKRDMNLYEESGGGVTLSGGEVMSQDIDFLVSLCKKLKRIGIHISIDTCGFAKNDSYIKIAPYVDTFLYDIKTLDEDKHRAYIGEGLDTILKNLKTVNDLASSKLNIRIPIIGKFNADIEDMERVARWLLDQKINVESINLLPYHNTGSGKYDYLGLEYDHDSMEVPSGETMEGLKEVFENLGFKKIKIGG